MASGSINPSPFIYWGQNASTLFLRVALRDVQTQPDVSLTENSISFKAYGVGAHGESMYEFIIETFSLISPEKSRMKLTGGAVNMEIPKIEPTNSENAWPRLTKTTQKYPWVKVDFDHMDVSEDEEEAEIDRKLRESAYLEKLSKDLKGAEAAAIADVKRNYLFSYNLFQCIAYSFIFVKVVIGLLRKDSYNSFEDIGMVLMICQLFAYLETVHAMLGLVKTGVFSPFIQTTGRNFVLFVLVWYENELQSSYKFTYLVLAWSAAEVIRYPFYMLSSLSLELFVVSWLRYTMWIILYPLGASLEWLLGYSAISLFSQSGKLSINLPNRVNFSFYMPWFIRIYLIILPYMLSKLMLHMYKLRQKKLGNKRSTDKEKKTQ